MIKIVNKDKDEPKIGDTYLYSYGGIEHIVLRCKGLSVSLTDPSIVWDSPRHCLHDNGIFYHPVDIEIKVL